MLKVFVNKIINWFYSTWAGGLYLEFLLWLDKYNNSNSYLNRNHVASIIRQSHKMSEALILVKSRVNELVRTKSKEEYDSILKEVNELIKLARRDCSEEDNKVLEGIQVLFRKTKDIETATDRARMIDNRIQDMYQLQNHVQKRTLLRTIRNLQKEGKTEEANKLIEEFNNKYGRSYTRY